jgi:hypothetical protein
MTCAPAGDPELINDLYQRLKALDPKTFERLCFQLLRERHPGVEIKAVDGAAGDEGVDVFTGELNEAPVIWQCKSFPNGIKESQKEQIRSSLRRAASNVRLSEWILCLSIDLDARAHQWFEKLRQSYAARFQIGLMQAGNIVSELLHRRTLLKAFFPEALLDVDALRGLLMKTGDLADDELADLTLENATQYIERLKDRDARFNYEIRFTPDGGRQERVPQAGLIASLRHAGGAVDVFARDVEAIKANPPRIEVYAAGTGIEKIGDLITTGRGKAFGAGEIAKITSNVWFLPNVTQPASVEIGPLRRRGTVPCRVTFGSGSGAIVYDFIEFESVRAGSQEIELVSRGDLPFRISVVLNPRNGSGDFALRLDGIGRDVREVRKIVLAVLQAMDSRHFEVYDLRSSKLVFRSDRPALGGLDRSHAELIDDLVSIAVCFGVVLRIPAEVTPRHLEDFAILRAIVTGEALKSGRFSCHFIKGTERPSLEDWLAGRAGGIRYEVGGATAVLFEARLSTGPLVIESEHAFLEDPEGVRSSIRTAEAGAPVQLWFRCERMYVRCQDSEKIEPASAAL